MSSKLVEAAAEFLSRDTSTKQKTIYSEQNFITVEEFEALSEEDQADYVKQIQELSTGTLIRYRRKADMQSDKSFMKRKSSLDPKVRNTETEVERRRDAGLRRADKKLSDRDIDTYALPQVVRSKSTGKLVKVPGAKTVNKRTTRED